MLPSLIASFSPTVMRYDEDLNTRCSHSRDQLAHIVIKPESSSGWKEQSAQDWSLVYNTRKPSPIFIDETRKNLGASSASD